MPKPAPTPRRLPRPSREEIVAARKGRQIRFALYVSSIVWAGVVSIWLMARWEYPYEADYGVVALLLVPAVVAGLCAGRQAWILYGGTAIVFVVFAAVFTPFLTVIFVCGAVLLLGYLLHLLRCSLTGRSVSEPPARDADAPRPAGASAVRGGALRTEKTTIANASPSGQEMRKRTIRFR